MKKKKALLTVPALCLAILFCGFTVLASNPNEVNYCSNCGAKDLYWASSPSEYYTTTHEVKTNLVDSNHQPIKAICTVGHMRTEVAKVCRNGHGAQWRGFSHTENHSYCGGSTSYYE